MRKALAFVSLFTSLSTLLCCALPALLVMLGLGATFAGLTSAIPQIIWIGENKVLVFGIGAFLLLGGGYMQWLSRGKACPIDADQAAACATAKDWSFWIYFVSLGLYAAGTTFAFGFSPS